MSLGTWYCSGAGSSPADLWGLADAGQALGVSVRRMSRTIRGALARLRVPVFLDTGAFSEVVIVDGRVEVVDPIGEEEWDLITSICLELATQREASTLVVSPDRVGDQDQTLALVRRWAERLGRISAAGGEVVLPCQRGALPLHVFAAEVGAVSQLQRYVLGITGNKAAASPYEVAEVVSSLRPPALHVLGCGPGSRRLGQIVSAARRAGHVGPVTCDSNGISARVGKTNGPRGRARALTAAQALERERADASTWCGGYGLDYTDEVGCLPELLSESARQDLRRDLSRAGYDVGRDDLTHWVTERWDDPVVGHLVDRAWARWYAEECRGICRRVAVTKTFTASPTQLELLPRGGC